MAFSVICVFLLALIQVDEIVGHGRLMNPPARNAMWRFGFPNPVNYNDNEVFCGGVGVMWSPEVNGKCGVCGDSWLQPAPRHHESGGVYAAGLMGRRYTPGQVIDVEVELTTNHWGFFELRLCPLEDPAVTERQECFNKYPLYLEGDSSYRFQIPNATKYGGHEIFNYKVKLPDGVTCSRCVIQWIYYTGNSWGICADGSGAIGCGAQETFRNCADVAVISNTPGFGPNGIVPSAPTTSVNNPFAIQVLIRNNATQQETYEPLVVRSQVCISRSSGKNVAANDEWCMRNCLKYPPNCPEEDCRCLSECHPTGKFAATPEAALHCHIHCLRYPQSDQCPEWCTCL